MIIKQAKLRSGVDNNGKYVDVLGSRLYYIFNDSRVEFNPTSVLFKYNFNDETLKVHSMIALSDNNHATARFINRNESMELLSYALVLI